MKFSVVFVILTLAAVLASALEKSSVGNTNTTEAPNSKRKGRLFSLFNVVQFKNHGCQSSVALTSGGYRNGTCFTSSECASKAGGLAAGNCAAGFGVCCVFTYTTTSTINQNCSYIQSPGFPSLFTPTGTNPSAFTYTIERQDNTICSLRLDFENFVLQGVAAGAACVDSMVVVLTTNIPKVPAICGTNTGQHMYLNVGTGSNDKATITFTLPTSGSSATATRTWDIKVSQIECTNPSSPPDNCLQYFVGTTGRFSTFNYAGGFFLPTQRYSACVRQEAGFCCVQFMQCDPTSFGIWGMGPTGIPATAAHDTFCFKTGTGAGVGPASYLGLGGSSSQCVQGSSGAPLTSAFCGGMLSTTAAGAKAMPVCDCTAPFVLDVTIVNTVALASGVGACLTYMQIPCT